MMDERSDRRSQTSAIKGETLTNDEADEVQQELELLLELAYKTLLDKDSPMPEIFEDTGLNLVANESSAIVLADALSQRKLEVPDKFEIIDRATGQMARASIEELGQTLSELEKLPAGLVIKQPDAGWCGVISSSGSFFIKELSAEKKQEIQYYRENVVEPISALVDETFPDTIIIEESKKDLDSE